MKILQINASYKPAYIYGGPTMSVAKLSEQLLKAENEVEVYTTTANGADELAVHPNSKAVIDGVTVTYFKRLTKDHTHFSPSLLWRLWKDASKFDIVHIHAWWNLVSVLSALVSLIRKTPVVISPRGTLSSYSFNNRNSFAKQLLHNLLAKRLLNSSHIHATSVAEQNALAVIVKPKMIFNLPNFVKLGNLSNLNMEIDNSTFKLLFLSRIDPKKGLDLLLKALPLLTVPYQLTIAGDGDVEYIDDLKNITRLNLSEVNISWIGFQKENKFDILRNHHLLVLPSYDENFGNVVIESLSVGTPVLISEHVGLMNYVLDNNLGWVCQTTSKSVSDAINNITFNKKAELLKIRATAPAIIRNDFDEQKLVQKYIAMYRQIIANG